MGSLLSTTPTSEDVLRRRCQYRAHRWGDGSEHDFVQDYPQHGHRRRHPTHDNLRGVHAAEVTRGLAKPMESNPDRRMMQNPIANTSYDWETGRAPKYMYKKGDSIVMEGDA